MQRKDGTIEYPPERHVNGAATAAGKARISVENETVLFDRSATLQRLLLKMIDVLPG